MKHLRRFNENVSLFDPNWVKLLPDVKPYYEYVNEDGTTERWELPKSVEEVTAEIQELIEIGKKEIEER